MALQKISSYEYRVRKYTVMGVAWNVRETLVIHVLSTGLCTKPMCHVIALVMMPVCNELIATS